MLFSVPGSQVKIAGSMHMLPAASPHLPAWVWDAYAWSEEVVIESNPPEILPYLPLTDGTTLAQYISAAHWQSLQETVGRAGVAAEQLLQWKPWAALLTLEAALQAYAPGVEVQFLARAQEKPIYMLEHGADIARLLDQVPVKIITDYLISLLDDPEPACARARQLHQGWLQRDLAAMYEVARETPMFQVPALRHAILGERNRAWMPRLRLALQAPRRTLVVVGALHLCGPDNLRELLEAEGYQLLEEE